MYDLPQRDWVLDLHEQRTLGMHDSERRRPSAGDVYGDHDMSALGLVCFLTLALGLTACTPERNNQDAGATSSGSCGVVQDQMQEIPTSFTNDPVPTAAGGSLPTGTYVLRTRWQHVSASGGPYADIATRVTIAFTGDRFETIGRVAEETDATRSAGTARMDGNDLELSYGCPRPGVFRPGFTAQDGGFTLTLPDAELSLDYVLVQE